MRETCDDSFSLSFLYRTPLIFFNQLQFKCKGNGQFKVRQRRRLLKCFLNSRWFWLYTYNKFLQLFGKMEERKGREREMMRKMGKVRISFPSFLLLVSSFSLREWIIIIESGGREKKKRVTHIHVSSFVQKHALKWMYITCILKSHSSLLGFSMFTSSYFIPSLSFSQ